MTSNNIRCDFCNLKFHDTNMYTIKHGYPRMQVAVVCDSCYHRYEAALSKYIDDQLHKSSMV